jgi:hypothetical protein
MFHHNNFFGYTCPRQKHIHNDKIKDKHWIIFLKIIFYETTLTASSPCVKQDHHTFYYSVTCKKECQRYYCNKNFPTALNMANL